MSKHRITVTNIHAGQPRPYADSEYVGDIFVEWQGMDGYRNKDAPFIPWDELSDDVVKSKYSCLVRKWKDKPEWWEPTLKSFAKVGKATWRVKVVEAYTD